MPDTRVEIQRDELVSGGRAKCGDILLRRGIGGEQGHELSGLDAPKGLGKLDDRNRARGTGGIDNELRIHLTRFVPPPLGKRKPPHNGARPENLLGYLPSL